MTDRRVFAVYIISFVLGILGGYYIDVGWRSSKAILPPSTTQDVQIECSADGYTFSQVQRWNDSCSFVRFKLIRPNMSLTTPYFAVPTVTER
jgi:hypothetical protein